jgi:hypothetical protein
MDAVVDGKDFDALQVGVGQPLAVSNNNPSRRAWAVRRARGMKEIGA